MRFDAHNSACWCRLPLDLLDGGGVWLQGLVGYLAALKADETIGHGGKRRVVRDDDDRDALATTSVLQQLQNLLAGLVVEGACGLIAQQELGILGEGTRDGYALLLAAGELGREVVHACFETYFDKRLGGIE